MIKMSCLLLTVLCISVFGQDVESKRRAFDKAKTGAARRKIIKEIAAFDSPEALEALRGIVKKRGNNAIGRAAMEAIGDLSSSEALEALEERAREERSSGLRKAALGGLARRGDAGLAKFRDLIRYADESRAVEILKASAKLQSDRLYRDLWSPRLSPQTDPPIRQAVLDAMSQRGDRRFFKHLKTLGKKENDVYRISVWISWAARFDSLEGLKAMLPFVEGSDRIRLSRKFGSVATSMKDAKVSAWFRSKGPRSKDPYIRVASALHLGTLAADASSEKSLIRLAGDAHDEVASAALKALTKHDSEAAVGAIEDRLGDRDPLIAAAALEARFRQSKGAVAQRRAVEEVAANSRDWRLRVAALQILASATPAESKSVLYGNLEHPRDSVRIAAAEALTGVREKASVDRLIDRLGKESGRSAYAFADALKHLTNFDWGLKQARWTKWWTKTREGFKLPPPPKSLAKSAAASRYGKYYGISIRSNRVVFLIDISGSMTGNFAGQPKIDRVKKDLSALIESFDADTQFNIIAFETGLIALLVAYGACDQAGAAQGSALDQRSPARRFDQHLRLARTRLLLRRCRHDLPALRRLTHRGCHRRDRGDPSHHRQGQPLPTSHRQHDLRRPFPRYRTLHEGPGRRELR